MKPEKRRIDSEIEVRQDGSDPVITGYAAVYNKPSRDFGGWVEIVAPGAFDRALSEKQDVIAKFEHEGGLSTLGRVSAGTLSLRSDRRGLLYTITPPNTQTGRDVVELIRRGDIKQSSFAFVPRQEKWQSNKDPNVRTLIDVDLFDVSPVAEPAYPDTTVAVRSDDDGGVADRLRHDRNTRMRLKLTLAADSIG